ncbi:MAG: signal peptide peptidase SppA [Acidobacteriota bacterium]|nr:signal peptide peptidase SppA [Acidobacteriota bacterium]
MAKFLIGVLTGGILAVVVVVIAVFAIARMKEKPATVADGSTLILRLEGDLPERPPIEFPIPFLQSKTPLTVENVWSILRKATVDARVKAIVLEPRGLSIGWGKLQEFRADLEQFKKSGKPLYAYLKSPGTREYYLATAASRIYMPPEDMLDLKGMRLELMYFKRTLDKLGVSVDVEHAGKYKDFGDMFTRTSMSPETAEVYNGVLDDLYGNVVQRIAEGRKKSPEEVRAIIDDGPFISPQALAKGLVDELRFEDEMFGELKTALKDTEIRKLSFREYLRVPLASVGLGGKQRIAFVIGDGAITRGDPESDSDTGGIQSEQFDKLLKRVGNDSSIKGVIVRIDSPGGEVSASDDIWREMNQLSRKKPLVISMSDAAASGGYYMAMTGDPIVAYPGTLTGSIGVVFGKPNLHGLYDKLGIDKDTLSRGRFATVDSDYQPLSDEGRLKLREGIDENYRAFVTKVANARKRRFQDIEPLAQGRVWMGDQAKTRGLVDELGGLDRAIELVKQKARIPVSERVNLITYPPKRSLFDLMFNTPSPEAAFDARLAGLFGASARPLIDSPELKLWMRGGMLRLTPYSLIFR